MRADTQLDTLMRAEDGQGEGGEEGEETRRGRRGGEGPWQPGEEGAPEEGRMGIPVSCVIDFCGYNMGRI